MTGNDLILRITKLIIEQTISQNLPTVVFLSVNEKGDLVKEIIRNLKGGTQDENDYTPEDWMRVAQIMEQLAEIPLLIKKTSDKNYILTETKTFIKGMSGQKGLVIIDSEESILAKEFTIGENISIIVPGENERGTK